MFVVVNRDGAVFYGAGTEPAVFDHWQTADTVAAYFEKGYGPLYVEAHVPQPRWAEDPNLNGCENHDAPGACDEECVALVQQMAADWDDTPYDPTGCSYRPPTRPEERPMLAPVKRVVYVDVHAHDCQCTDPVHDVVPWAPSVVPA